MIQYFIDAQLLHTIKLIPFKEAVEKSSLFYPLIRYRKTEWIIPLFKTVTLSNYPHEEGSCNVYVGNS